MEKQHIVLESNNVNIRKKFGGMMISFLQLMRIHQWPKNFFVFSGILISFQSFGLGNLINSILAFFLFCGISSSVYIINDIVDIEKDKLHPIKKHRPIPAGKITISLALILEFVILMSTIFLAFVLNGQLGFIVIVYYVLNLLYTWKLKEIVLIDVLIISTGFVLRAISGIIITQAKNSFWLLMSIAFLTLFLGINKRKGEIIQLKQGGEKHRKNLGEYSIELINEIIPMLTSCTIISYSCYVLYETGYRVMIITIPIVLYGILRYQYLVNRKKYGGRPELVLLRDKPTILTIILWCLVFVSSKALLGMAILQ